MIKLHNQIPNMDIEQQKQSVYFRACGIDYIGLVKIDMKGLMYMICILIFCDQNSANHRL